MEARSYVGNGQVQTRRVAPAATSNHRARRRRKSRPSTPSARSPSRRRGPTSRPRRSRHSIIPCLTGCGPMMKSVSSRTEPAPTCCEKYVAPGLRTRAISPHKVAVGCRLTTRSKTQPGTAGRHRRPPRPLKRPTVSGSAWQLRDSAAKTRSPPGSREAQLPVPGLAATCLDVKGCRACGQPATETDSPSASRSSNVGAEALSMIVDGQRGPVVASKTTAGPVS